MRRGVARLPIGSDDAAAGVFGGDSTRRRCYECERAQVGRSHEGAIPEHRGYRAPSGCDLLEAVLVVQAAENRCRDDTVAVGEMMAVRLSGHGQALRRVRDAGA